MNQKDFELAQKLDWEKINLVLSAKLGYQTSVRPYEKKTMSDYSDKINVDLVVEDKINLVAQGQKFFGPLTNIMKECHLDASVWRYSTNYAYGIRFDFRWTHKTGGTNGSTACEMIIHDDGSIFFQENY